VATPIAGLVEPRSEQAVQALDSSREVRIADLDDQMEMSGEQAIRMADPAVLTEGLLHEPEVETPQLVVREDGKPGDPSRGDVIDAVGLLDAEQARHVANVAAERPAERRWHTIGALAMSGV
jgi:hypothetical protein